MRFILFLIVIAVLSFVMVSCTYNIDHDQDINVNGKHLALPLQKHPQRTSSVSNPVTDRQVAEIGMLRRQTDSGQTALFNKLQALQDSLGYAGRLHEYRILRLQEENREMRTLLYILCGLCLISTSFAALSFYRLLSRSEKQ
jgi:hypothetical protein